MINVRIFFLTYKSPLTFFLSPAGGEEGRVRGSRPDNSISRQSISPMPKGTDFLTAK
jgi:hypothetical protein